jgi:hypothetical protein
MRVIGTVAAAVSLAAGLVAFAGDAEARYRYWRHAAWHHDYNHDHDIDAFGAGVLGFATGRVVGRALAGPRYYAPRGYAVAPYPYYAYPPVVVVPDASREGGDAR